MLLSELLNPQAIELRLAAGSKREALVELVDLLERAHGIKSQGELLDRVLRRESMMSTGIGNGVAIPHGKARAVDRMVASCAIARNGIDFEAVDGEPVNLLILLVSPENVAAPHVRVLANISRLLREESVRGQLRDAANPDEFMAMLRAAEARHLHV
ncbi:MAG: PTS sugar transporter subunit IIA [Candidatus Eisenbacteria bacterium]|uniref:PTS sugar transporter subunit IIA n=1 Tax=Eiseniibacteriota bacterium TaxID=2212470 RepID=A0A849SK34_UNCEI|nr:PTS sugar transporter subunit IIA [Candidatus Eisenbacteria bacterium]